MAPDTVRLLEVDPDLARFLAYEDQVEAERLTVRTVTIELGQHSVEALLGRAALGATVLEGMVLQRLQLANHLTMKIFGPGDLLARADGHRSMLIGKNSVSAVEGTRLALLGNEMLAAIRRWPGLAVGLRVRSAEQAERVAVQLAICQLPRVEERLMALFWWLAESWGRVTSAGTVVPLGLTHDVLGALVGARRPTVTLAIGELVERGAIARQDRGWLLLEPPPASGDHGPDIDNPELIPLGDPVWRAVPDRAASTAAARAELLETVARLREEHRVRERAMRARLDALRQTRAAVEERRARAR